MSTAPAVRTVEDIRRVADERGVAFDFAQFVDMHARPSAKLVPAANLDDLVTDGAGFAGFAAGDIGQLPSDPDLAAIPDLSSVTSLPWEPTLARFACDIHGEGRSGRMTRARSCGGSSNGRGPRGTSS
jgi:glutamine synthetase